MKLFIFEPMIEYCGGGKAVIANSFNEAVAMLKDFQKKENEKQGYKYDDREIFCATEAEATKVYDNKKTHYMDTWYLTGEFEVINEQSRVILNNYNCA